MNALNQFENHKPMHMEEKPVQEQGEKTIRQKNDAPQYPGSIFEEEDMGC